PTTTSSSSGPVRPGSTAPARWPTAASGWRSWNGSGSEASARSGRASRRRRCCARVKRCRRRATSARPRRSTWKRHLPGGTSWSRATPTPAGSAGWRTARSTSCGAPASPPVPGLRELEGVWGTRDATGLKSVPSRLLVLGGGSAGVELAQAIHRLGSDVTLVEVADHVLPREAAPLGEALGEALRRDGIELVLGANASGARRDGDEFVLVIDDGR